MTPEPNSYAIRGTAQPDGYAIWDTERGVWWRSPRGKKVVWPRRCDAADAWNAGLLHRAGPAGYRLFSQQSRFVTKPIIIIEIQT